MRINLIAAVGKRGQLGLNGKMPWRRDLEDMSFFRTATTRNIVIFGSRTFDDLFSESEVWDDRLILRMSRERTAMFDGGEVVGYLDPGVDRIIRAFEGKLVDVFIAGGGQIYDLWLPHIRRFFVTRVNYDGEADTWLRNPWGLSSSTDSAQT